MKHLYLIISFVFIAFAANAQYVYNDFDGNQNDEFTGWPNAPVIVANPDASGINTSANVAQWDRSGEQWAHVWTELDGKIDFSTGSSFSLKIWSPKACDVLLKLEDKANSGTFTEVSQSIANANEWVELTFDFSGAASGTYDKVIIFMDFAATEENTFYFDDVTGPEYVSGGTPSAAHVYNNFDDMQNDALGGWPAEPVIIANPDVSGINTSANVAQWDRPEEQWSHLFMQVPGMLDFSTGDIFYLKIWSPIPCDVLFKLESSIDPNTFVEVSQTLSVANEWTELSFAFTGAASDTYDKIVIFPDFSSTTANTFYLDDIQGPAYSGAPAPKPLEARDIQDNFENDGYSTIMDWKFQDPEMLDITIVEDPTNAENHVMDYARSGNFEWTNAQFVLNFRMDLSERNVFETRAYFPSTNDYGDQLTKTLAIKLQNSLLGGDAWTTQTEIKLEVTDLDQWVDLVFDFSAIADSVNYDQVVVQFGGEGHTVPGTFYLDDFKLMGGAGPKPLLATDVQDNFEDDGYSTMHGWKFQDPEMLDITVVEDPVNAGNHVVDYARSGNFEWANAQVIIDHRMDLSERNRFEMKVYFPSTNNYDEQLTPTAALKLQNSLMGGMAWSTQTEIKLEVTEFDAWVTLTFDFSAIADSVNYDQIVVQFGGEGHFVPAQFYFDDIVLLGATSIAEYDVQEFSVYPNPAKDRIILGQEFSEIRIYDISGKEVMNVNQPKGTLNVVELRSGMYIIRASGTEGAQYFSRFMKN